MGQITSISLLRLKDELHVQFHESIHTLLAKIDLKSLWLEELHSLYRSAFDNELESLSIIRKSELTRQISDQDMVRDAIFRGFSDTVKGLRNHFSAEHRIAANLLWNVFLHYGNVTKKPLDAQTAATNDMLREFQRADLQAAISTLKVEDWVQQLEIENRTFHDLVMQRYNEQSGKTVHRMKITRTDSDKYYRAIASVLDNHALTGKKDATVQPLISEWNTVVGRFKTILAQEFGRKNASKPDTRNKKEKILTVEKLEDNTFRVSGSN